MMIIMGVIGLVVVGIIASKLIVPVSCSLTHSPDTQVHRHPLEPRPRDTDTAHTYSETIPKLKTQNCVRLLSWHFDLALISLAFVTHTLNLNYVFIN